MCSPITFTPIASTNKWTILSTYWINNSVEFNQEQDGWRIRERLRREIFSLRRDYVTNRRYTDVDLIGLLGVSLINIEDKHVYITEGVSDFFTAKLLMPDKNILGVTQLGGSKLAKKVLISLFDSVTILADRDATGMANAQRWRCFLSNYNINAKIWQPSIGKDITDEFLFNLKLNERIQF